MRLAPVHRGEPEPARSAPEGHREGGRPPVRFPGESLPAATGDVHQRAGGPRHPAAQDGRSGIRPGRVPVGQAHPGRPQEGLSLDCLPHSHGETSPGHRAQHAYCHVGLANRSLKFLGSSFTISSDKVVGS